MSQKNEKIKFPSNLINPIKKFLENEIIRLKRSKKFFEKSDPFSDTDRGNQNSLEEDVDEQVGHFDSEVKIKFLTKRIVELRKALSRIKIGKYGVCEGCGKMIDTDRLAIKPDATICVKCEKDKE